MFYTFETQAARFAEPARAVISLLDAALGALRVAVPSEAADARELLWVAAQVCEALQQQQLFKYGGRVEVIPRCPYTPLPPYPYPPTPLPLPPCP